ncbi:MAG TPA: hypothetical protein VHG51_18715 [Longimicrobiaceae bacterium]|nr:hypothetical protein [Longimicrobiaceae bacterium]
MRPDRLLALAALGAALASCDTAPTHADHPAPAAASAARAGADENRTLAAIRRGTARYHRVEAAEADDYQVASPCVSHPFLGAMGYHYANFGLMDATVDPSAPEILVYAPQKNGKLKLVAVEFMVPAAPWDSTHAGPPTLAGVQFDDHRDPATWHDIPFAHYDLHAWVWQNNPSGMFFPFNPTVSCG